MVLSVVCVGFYKGDRTVAFRLRSATGERDRMKRSTVDFLDGGMGLGPGLNALYLFVAGKILNSYGYRRYQNTQNGCVMYYSQVKVS